MWVVAITNKRLEYIGVQNTGLEALLKCMWLIRKMALIKREE